jgi:hypothetical protein
MAADGREISNDKHDANSYGLCGRLDAVHGRDQQGRQITVRPGQRGFPRPNKQALRAGGVGTGTEPCLIGTTTLGVGTAPVLGFSPTELPVAPAGAKPTSVAVADFNGDHHLDLAATDSTGGTVTLAKGDGTGKFMAFAPATLAVPAANFVAAADFNNDGMVDLIVTGVSNGKGTISVFQGHANGTFTPAGSGYTETDTGGVPNGIAIADFNGDGLLDAAFTDYLKDRVTVLLNGGNFSFSPDSGSPYSLVSGARPVSIVAGDFDRDGILDLAVADNGTKTYSILQGKGRGSFNPPTPVTMAPAHNPRYLALGDFDNNGILDLATANSDDGSVSVLIGQGNGTFTQKPDLTIRNGQGAVGLVAADIDGDGNQDLAVSDYKSFILTVLLGEGTGGFPNTGSAPAGTAATGAGFIAVGAFDESGLLNVAMSNASGTGARILQPQLTSTATATLTHAQVAGKAGDPPHQIVAHYEGNAQYLPSDASGKLPSVGPAPLTDSVSLIATPPTLGTINQKTGLEHHGGQV